MNIDFTYFSLIEKIPAYGGIFIASLFIIILSSLLHNEKVSRKTGNIFYLISIILLFFLNVFIFLYLRARSGFVAGIQIEIIYLFLLIVFYTFIMFNYNESSAGTNYIMLFAKIICLQILFLNQSLITVLFSFIVFETVISILSGKTITKKFFYFIITIVFLSLFYSEKTMNIQFIGISGVMVFLLLSTFASTWTLDRAEISDEKIKKLKSILFLPLLVCFVVFFKMIKIYNSISPFIYPLFMVSFILLLLSVINFLTEENLTAFCVCDFINVFYLAVFAFSVLPPGEWDVIIVFILMLAAAIVLGAFFSDTQVRYSISYARYNFNKIKGSGALLAGIIFTLLVEIYLINKILKNFINFNPYIQAIIIIAGFVYAINIINKIFIIFSMAIRIKIDNLRNILFNKILIKPALFVMVVISLALWWIKNG